MQPSASLFFFFTHFSLVFCTFLPFSVAVSLSFTFYVLTHFFALSLFISLSLCLTLYLSLPLLCHSLHLSAFISFIISFYLSFITLYISLPMSPFCPFRLTIGSSRSALVQSTPGLRRKRPLLVHCSRPSLLMFSGKDERRREGEQKKRDEKRKKGEEKRERERKLGGERERKAFIYVFSYPTRSPILSSDSIFRMPIHLSFLPPFISSLPIFICLHLFIPLNSQYEESYRSCYEEIYFT